MGSVNLKKKVDHNILMPFNKEIKEKIFDVTEPGDHLSVGISKNPW